MTEKALTSLMIIPGSTTLTITNLARTGSKETCIVSSLTTAPAILSVRESYTCLYWFSVSATEMVKSPEELFKYFRSSSTLWMAAT